MTDSSYLLGSSDEELQRLSTQHQVWLPEAQALWQRAGIRAGDTVLDLGCGPGFASVDLAERVGPSGRVIAFDQSKKYLDHLRKVIQARGLSSVQIIQGNAEEITLPERVNHVYSRWLFCFFPKPGKVVERLASLVKPGGKLSICDYYRPDHELNPASPALERLMKSVAESWRLTGGNLEVQKTLPGILERHGFKVVDLLPISRAGKPGSRYWNWPKTFFQIFIPGLIQKGLMSPAESENFWREWTERESDPSAFIKTTTLMDIIAEKT